MSHSQTMAILAIPRLIMNKLCSVMMAIGFMSTVYAQNNQQVIIHGGAINISGPGSHALMNISSTKNISNVRKNNQITVVNGAVVNSAMFGAYSELNIASRNGGGSGAGNQIVSVGGPMVIQAAGMGVRNVVNIGGR